MDQAKQILLGKWVFLRNMDTGQLFFMQGLGGGLAGQCRFNGNSKVYNLTNVKISNQSGMGILTFQIEGSLYKAMIHPVHKIMNGTHHYQYPFNAYKM